MKKMLTVCFFPFYFAERKNKNTVNITVDL